MPRKFLAASAASSSRELESWPAAFKMPVSAFEDGNTFDVPRVARFSTTIRFIFLAQFAGCARNLRLGRGAERFLSYVAVVTLLCIVACCVQVREDRYFNSGNSRAINK